MAPRTRSDEILKSHNPRQSGNRTPKLPFENVVYYSIAIYVMGISQVVFIAKRGVINKVIHLSQFHQMRK